MGDAIRPDHYKAGGLEPIDIMRQKFSTEKLKGFLEGNVLKYLLRYEEKNGYEDLKKAQTYLNWLVEVQEDVPEPSPEPGMDPQIYEQMPKKPKSPFTLLGNRCPYCGDTVSSYEWHLQLKHAAIYQDMLKGRVVDERV